MLACCRQCMLIVASTMDQLVNDMSKHLNVLEQAVRYEAKSQVLICAVARLHVSPKERDTTDDASRPAKCQSELQREATSLWSI